jgi:predicted ATPase/DNA-binding NarL/FixJ family response regulator
MQPANRQSSILIQHSTPFVGRERERLLLRIMLRRADVRLLTLCGAGGIGKSRLAIQLAEELAGDFPDGVLFIELAAVRDPARVLPTIATALGIVEVGHQRVLDQLMSVFGGRCCLVVLDNFEQVRDAATELAPLLAAVADLKLVVTSRAPLNISWEHVFPVPPLIMPTRGTQPSLDQLRQFDAARLFETHAQRTNAGFVLTDEDAAAVAEICRRLDGLPLAIELAAARCRVFSPQALLTRLDYQLAFLNQGPHDRPARQQTLRGTIDWSYQLLTPREQRLFAQLSIFDGCTAEAAEAVCGSADDPPFSVTETLASLVEQSLVQSAAHAGRLRFTLLETIRAYALEQLADSPDRSALEQRHAALYCALAEAAAANLEGPVQASWLEQLEQEHNNLRSALRWAIAQRDAATGVRLVLALRLFWFMRGYLSEGRERIAAVLALDLPDADRARVLDCAGFLARYQGDYTAAARTIRKSLAIWRQLSNRQGVADALSNLGYVMLCQSDYATAQTLYSESLDLNRSLHNDQGRADCLSHLGTAAFYEGDYHRAEQLHAESLGIWQELGDIEGLAYALYHLGDAYLALGNQLAAAQRYTASLRASGELSWPIGLVGACEGAACLLAQSQPHTAIQLASFAAQMRQLVAIPSAPDRAAVLDQYLQQARRGIEKDAYAIAWAAGKGLSAQDAAKLAIAELPQNSPTGSVQPPGGHVDDRLTAREQEIVQLIATGQSNRAIAAALVISIKTVEAHMSRIFSKLGFTSRAQIAAWAVAQRLDTLRAARPADDGG